MCSVVQDVLPPQVTMSLKAHSGFSGRFVASGLAHVFWVAVKELQLSYYNGHI